MSWMLSIGIGLITAVLGCLGAGYVATLWVRWYRISSFEGASGYYVVFIALLGALVGLVVGIVASRWVPASEGAGFGKGLLYATSALAALLVVVMAAGWVAADIPPTHDGRPLEVIAEIRFPAGAPRPVATENRQAYLQVDVPGRRRQPSGWIDLGAAKDVAGRWIVGASTPLHTNRARALLRVSLNDNQHLLFPLLLKGRATDGTTWSEWMDAAWNAGEPQPPIDQRFSFRFRVAVVPPPPPRPSAAAIAAEKQAAEHAEFAAIPADAPIPAWLPYLGYGVPDERRQAALKHIISRPGFLGEFTALSVSPEAETASGVLRLVELLPEPSPEINAPVAAAGRALAARLRTVNATPVAQDPSYLGAAEIAVRFSAWMVAVRTLRAKAGGDFTSELKEILELARVRSESHALRMDVVRVASFYLHEWTGLAPLPSDPPPR